VSKGSEAASRRVSKSAALGCAIAALCAIAVYGQFISSSGQSRAAAAQTEAVQYLFPEQVSLPAGKPSTVALHFRIAPGLHINSHTPGDEFLIPTSFSIPAGEGVRLAVTSYPAGTTMALPADPKTKLNVYTGEFVIQARLVAEAGEHLVRGKLRYQACDQTQCMPPKTITVAMDVTGK